MTARLQQATRAEALRVGSEMLSEFVTDRRVVRDREFAEFLANHRAQLDCDFARCISGGFDRDREGIAQVATASAA